MRREIEVLVDDLDGSDAVESLSFGLDGQAYMIDLSAGHATALREALAQYVAAARRLPARASGVVAPRDSSEDDAGAIRAWAQEQGLEVSGRGRISAESRAAYRRRL